MPVLDASLWNAPWQIVAGQHLIERFCGDGVNHVPGPSTVVVRTAVQKAAGYYRTALPHTDDFEMWMRLAHLGPAARTEADLAILRFHGSARSAAARRVQSAPYHQPPAMPWHDEAAFESFFAHEGAALPEATRLHRLARRNLWERAYWAAVAHLCRGQLGPSWDLLKFALSRRRSPRSFRPCNTCFAARTGSIGWSRSPPKWYAGCVHHAPRRAWTDDPQLLGSAPMPLPYAHSIAVHGHAPDAL